MASEFKDDPAVRAMRFDGWNFVPLILEERPSASSGENQSDAPESDRPLLAHDAPVDQSASAA